MPSTLPRLPDPPITEVVCGVFFAPIANLDPLALGAYWQGRRAEFPRHEFKAPVVPGVEGLEFSLGPDVGPIRTWLISGDDVFIIQVQHDRFYLNWRARQHDYPRFSDRDGRPGLLSKFLAEEGAFEAFCERELGAKPRLLGIELAKIDHLERGRHWRDPTDLAVLLPMLGQVLQLAEQELALTMRLSTSRLDGSMDLAIDTLMRVAQPPIPLLKLETRRTIRSGSHPFELRPKFELANQEVNVLFEQLIPRSQHYRFEKGWKP